MNPWISSFDRDVHRGEMSAAAKDVESSGRSSPLGATVFPGGVNFSVFSRNASGVELLFFDREDDAQPARVIADRSRGQSHLSLLARIRAGCATGAALRISGAGAIRSRERDAV